MATTTAPVTADELQATVAAHERYLRGGARCEVPA